MATTLEDLVAIEEIKRLKVRYCRLIDENRRAGLRDIVTDDIEYEYENWRQGKGADDFIGPIQPREEGHKTLHRVFMPDIEILSEVTAKATWAMEDIVEHAATAAHEGFRGYGHYHEEYRKVDGEWRISSIFATRVRTEALGARDTLE